MYLTGSQGKTIRVDEDFVEISQKSLLYGTSERKIPMSKISSVEVKKPGILAGYIQIAEIGASQNKGMSSGAMQAVRDENSILLGSNDDYEIALKLKSYIEKQIVRIGKPTQNIQQLSSADEIVKFKKLLDEGILTQAEFDAKKKLLLGI